MSSLALGAQGPARVAMDGPRRVPPVAGASSPQNGASRAEVLSAIRRKVADLEAKLASLLMPTASTETGYADFPDIDELRAELRNQRVALASLSPAPKPARLRALVDAGSLVLGGRTSFNIVKAG